MGLETARLLIVVGNLDYRPYVEEAPDQAKASHKAEKPDETGSIAAGAGLPTKLSPILAADDDLNLSHAIESHIVEAATHWRSHLQEVAIYSAYAPTAYREVSASGVQFFGSGLSTSDQNQTEQQQTQRIQTDFSQAEARSTELDSADWPFKQENSAASSASPRSFDRRIFGSQTEHARIRPIADYCPTHVVICIPNAALISWATSNQLPSVVLLSDWREPLGWRQRWQHQQLVKQLNQKSVSWIGSHGAYACKILCASGIKPQKLIPWEWPQPQLPIQYAPRQLRHDRDTIALVYVGPIHKTAGVDDLIWAVSHLHQRGKATFLQVICETSDEKSSLKAPPLPQATEEDPLCQGIQSQGTASLLMGSTHGYPIAEDDILGEVSVEAVERKPEILDPDMRRLKHLVQQLELTEYVTFTPTLSEPKLLQKMRNADLAVMPGYDRSWPATTPPILQLAMATRTPVIASDHKHFKEHLFHGVNAMIFPEGNAKSMAHRIERVMDQPQLYAQLSEALDIPLHAIKVPARWADLVDRWLQSDEAPPVGTRNYQQLCSWALSSGRYQSITPMQKPPKHIKEKAFLSKKAKREDLASKTETS